METMHLFLLSEKILLICKAETQIRNCSLGATDTVSDKTKPCFQAIPGLSPSEPLLWIQASVLGMF